MSTMAAMITAIRRREATTTTTQAHGGRAPLSSPVAAARTQTFNNPKYNGKSLNKSEFGTASTAAEIGRG